MITTIKLITLNKIKNAFLRKIEGYSHGSLKNIVTLGFCLLLILMILLTSIGLSRMAQNDSRMEHILNEQATKSVLVASMRNVARDRIISLFTALTLDDPFERDSELSHFNKLAGQFMRLRNQLEVSGFNADESEQFARILAATRYAANSQIQVANLINSNNLHEAQKILVNVVVPAQNQVINTYDRFLSLQTEKSKISIIQAKKANKSTYMVMVTLVAIALMLSSMVALFVIRRIGVIEDALFEEKELAEITLHAIAEGVITTDAAGNVTYLNPVAEQLTGWSVERIKNQKLDTIYSVIDETTKLVFSNMLVLRHLDGPTIPLGNRLLIRSDGHQFPIQDSIAPIRNKLGNVIGAVVVFNDVSEARNLTKDLTWQASHDVLTGLANRREFELKLSSLLDSAKNKGKQHFLLYLDLDKFKSINDTCGHQAGDQLLKLLSRKIETTIRNVDLLARLGGDEFALLLESCPADVAFEIAEKIRLLIAELKFMWEEKQYHIGVSIGVVSINSRSGKEIEIMARADAACYQAKEEGRNRICFVAEQN